MICVHVVSHEPTSCHRYLLVSMVVGALGCRAPIADESGEGSTAVCDAIDVQTDTCADSERRPGEFCLGPSEAIELEYSSGTPQRLRPELVVADFDADGAMDLMTGHAVGLGDGQGGFEVIKIPRGIEDPQPGNFDDQPGVDIAYFYNVDMQYGVVNFILGGPTHPGIDIQPQGTQLGGPDEERLYAIESIAVGDFNTDGHDDVAVAATMVDFDLSDTQLWLLTHVDDFQFDAELLSSINSDFPARVSAGLLFGDSIDDLLWGRGQLLHGSDAGPVANADDWPGGEIWSGFGFNVSGRGLLGHYIDCDELPDLVVPISDGIIVFPGMSAAPHIGGDYQRLSPESEGPWEPWDVADLNDDHVPDLVVIGPAGLAISFTTSSGTLGPLTPVMTPHPWVAARVADVDADGTPELIGLFADQDDVSGGFEIIAMNP